MSSPIPAVSDRTTSRALVSVLNGRDWVPGLASLPVGEMKKMVGPAAQEAVTAQTQPNKARQSLRIVLAPIFGSGSALVNGFIQAQIAHRTETAFQLTFTSPPKITWLVECVSWKPSS